MANIATSLTEFSDSSDTRTYSLSGHTVSKPKLVIQKRKVPSSPDGVAEVSIRVLSGTTDISGAVISNRVSFEVISRNPIKGLADDVTAMLVVLRDIVASDEFASTVSTQNWIKA